MSEMRLPAWINAAEGAGIRFIFDEILSRLTTYAVSAVTASELLRMRSSSSSFSNIFCMTGWRVALGMVVPEPLFARDRRLQPTNLLLSCPDACLQIAAEAAFVTPARDGRSPARHTRRIALLIAMACRKPGSTNSCPPTARFTSTRRFEFTSDSFECQQMLEQAHVAQTPASTSIRFNGHQFIRFSYALSVDEMRRRCAIARGSIEYPNTSIPSNHAKLTQLETSLSSKFNTAAIVGRHFPLAAVLCA